MVYSQVIVYQTKIRQVQKQIKQYTCESVGGCIYSELRNENCYWKKKNSPFHAQNQDVRVGQNTTLTYWPLGHQQWKNRLRNQMFAPIYVYHTTRNAQAESTINVNIGMARNKKTYSWNVTYTQNIGTNTHKIGSIE